MLKEEGVVEIMILRRQGYSIRGIARELGISRNTVREYLRTGKHPVYSSRPQRQTKLDPFKLYIQERVVDVVNLFYTTQLSGFLHFG